jgi:hypothetical protein
MSKIPHVVLLMLSFAGYDRRLPHGNARSGMASMMPMDFFTSSGNSLQ